MASEDMMPHEGENDAADGADFDPYIFDADDEEGETDIAQAA